MGEHRFLCDEMYKGLARRLRAAGYDTTLAPDGFPDREVVARACAEGRWLVTRDAGIAEHAAAGPCLVLLEQERPEAAAAELAARLDLDWHHAPFSRCLVCNTPLERPPAAVAARAPVDVAGPLWWCPACDRLYWEGSHTRRMRRELEALHQRTAGDDRDGG